MSLVLVLLLLFDGIVADVDVSSIERLDGDGDAFGPTPTVADDDRPIVDDSLFSDFTVTIVGAAAASMSCDLGSLLLLASDWYMSGNSKSYPVHEIPLTRAIHIHPHGTHHYP